MLHLYTMSRKEEEIVKETEEVTEEEEEAKFLDDLGTLSIDGGQIAFSGRATRSFSFCAGARLDMKGHSKSRGKEGGSCYLLNLSSWKKVRQRQMRHFSFSLTEHYRSQQHFPLLCRGLDTIPCVVHHFRFDFFLDVWSLSLASRRASHFLIHLLL